MNAGIRLASGIDYLADSTALSSDSLPIQRCLRHESASSGNDNSEKSFEPVLLWGDRTTYSISGSLQPPNSDQAGPLAFDQITGISQCLSAGKSQLTGHEIAFAATQRYSVNHPTPLNRINRKSSNTVTVNASSISTSKISHNNVASSAVNAKHPAENNTRITSACHFLPAIDDSASRSIFEVNSPSHIKERFTDSEGDDWRDPLLTDSKSSIDCAHLPIELIARHSSQMAMNEGSTAILSRRSRIGQITEYSKGITSNSGPRGIALGSDGNMWFTMEFADRIGRINPKNGKATEYSTGITKDAFLTGIALGSDGNMWYTEYSGNKIGKITPSGEVTAYSTGITKGAKPAAIALGPDGNMWFTERDGDKIGRITPSGQVTEFPVASGSGPRGIAMGSDGNMWFTQYFSGKIGKINPATGQVTEYSTGISPGSRPYWIEPGPDGNMWFTVINRRKIGMITPSGNVTEYPIPHFGVEGIAQGPDGNMWFTVTIGNKLRGGIGRINPTTGHAKIYTKGLSAFSVPREIEQGPDGNMWFTEFSGDKIGRVSVGSLIPWKAKDRRKAKDRKI